MLCSSALDRSAAFAGLAWGRGEECLLCDNARAAFGFTDFLGLSNALPLEPAHGLNDKYFAYFYCNDTEHRQTVIAYNHTVQVVLSALGSADGARGKPWEMQ
jgi:hypothetical protein